MKIFILGANGFIGKHVYDSLSSSDQYSVKGFSSKQCNLLKPADLSKQLSEFDKDSVVVFASAITRLRDNSFLSMSDNIQMTINLCNFIKKYKIRQMIFLSTIDVYGLVADNTVISEKTTPAPNDNYAISKLTSEYILIKELARQNIPLTIFRLTGTYGMGDDGKSTINLLVNSALEKGKITIFGTGENLRDFIYFEDLPKIISLAIKQKSNSIINIATGKSKSILDISRLILELTGNSQDNVVFVPGKTSSRVKDLIFNTIHLKNTFPALKMTSIEEGVKKYLLNL